jgi:DHA1 family bicyclomycin/chloramphenicol resistance-like MFS transporter
VILSSGGASASFTVLLGVLVALTAIGMDMFLPSVPAIAHAFGMPAAAGQLAVTTYLLGVAAGQLAWGPLADRYGRKPVLLCALALFLVSSAACAAAGSLEAVALLRFAQGVGTTSGPVIARSIVRDLAAQEEAARLLARITVVFGFFPVAGPLVGAQVLALGGWRSLFWLYAIVALALWLVVAFRLPETAPRERPSISPARIVAAYAALLGDRRFVAPLATSLSAQMGILAFVAGSSLVLVQALHVTPQAFGLLFATVMLGQMVGGFAASRLVGRFGIERMIRIGAALALASGIALALLAYLRVPHWSAIVLPMLGYILGCAFLVPNAMAAALTPFPQIAGSASSLLGALPFACGALVSAALAAAFDGTPRPLALAVALAGASAFAAERLLLRPMALRERARVHG